MAFPQEGMDIKLMTGQFCKLQLLWSRFVEIQARTDLVLVLHTGFNLPGIRNRKYNSGT